jgi:cysteine desulfurase
MTKPRSYLDHNASAPLLESAREAMLVALEIDANPSSVHDEGRRLRRMIEQARSEVAALCNASPEHVVFTSGASEAASMLLCPDWTMGRGPLTLSRLYVSAADHPCLLSGGRFAPERVRRIGVDADGVTDLAELREALAAHVGSEGLPLVAIHAANNETGVIQPIAEIARLTRDAGGMLVVDAVQEAGRIPIDITADYGDFLILSSHKMGGPKGAGAIVGTSDLAMPRPLVTGGGQERGHRAGTENAAAIAGFGAAAREAMASLGHADEVRRMRDRIEAEIVDLAPGATIFGAGVERLPNTCCFAVPGMKAETMQIAFDLAGVAVSAGSACSSGKVGRSHVLQAMGFEDESGAIRVSIGLKTGESEFDHFREVLASILSRRDREPRAA